MKTQPSEPWLRWGNFPTRGPCQLPPLRSIRRLSYLRALSGWAGKAKAGWGAAGGQDRSKGAGGAGTMGPSQAYQSFMGKFPV